MKRDVETVYFMPLRIVELLSFMIFNALVVTSKGMWAIKLSFYKILQFLTVHGSKDIFI